MRAAQSRTMSLLEAVANVAIGFWIAVGTQRLVFPLFGIETAFATDLAIGAVFTGVSIVRSYVMRRLFERISRVDPTQVTREQASP
jgi:hypothetical protein